MILDVKAMQWQGKVSAEAARRGWTVYGQTLRNQRQRDPSLVLIRDDRVIVAYLRSSRPRAAPPVERFAGRAGVEAYVWQPKDWADIVIQLAIGEAEQVDG